MDSLPSPRRRADERETLDLEAAAALLNADHDTVATYARTGELPATRIGKGWVFLREDVIAFLRTKIQRDTQEHLAKRSVLEVTLEKPSRSAARGRRTQLPDLSAVLPKVDR